MQRTIVQGLGWFGVIAILTAYGLLNLGVISANHMAYLWLNLTGSIAIAYEAGVNRDRQPMVLNLVWALIAVVGLLRLWVN